MSKLSDQIIDDTTDYEIKVESYIMNNTWEGIGECLREVLKHVKHPNPNVPTEVVIEFITDTYNAKQGEYYYV